MSKSEKLKELTVLALAQYEAEQFVLQKEEELATAKKTMRVISETKIPELMDEVGFETFKTTDGLIISIKENLRAQISKANHSEAMAWLVDNGHAKLIKHKIALVPSNTEEASNMFKMLDEAKFPYSDSASVHAGTLSKFVREKMEAGEDVPQDLFGIFRQRVSKVQIG